MVVSLLVPDFNIGILELEEEDFEEVFVIVQLYRALTEVLFGDVDVEY